MGILSGNNGRLNPNAPITREEVCVVLYRAFLLQDGGSAAQRFSDAGQISDWAQAAVAAMAAKGCLTGDSQGNVNASKTITRAEFAQMMDNLAKGYPTGAETGGVIEGSAIMRAGQSLSGMTIKGDLILADGLGANDVDLSDCTVEGRIIVRGGSAVTLSGATRTGGVVAAASTALTNNTGSKLSSVSVEGSNANVTLSGAIGTVDVKADNVTVNAAAGAAIDAVQTAANGTTVQGSGEVAAVNAAPGASNTSVTTNHTDITVAEGAGTVTSNSGSLAAGQSGTTDNKGALQATNANEADTSKPSKDSSDSSSSSDTKRPSRPRPSDTSDMVAVTDESGRMIGSFERGTVLTVDPNNGSHTYTVTVGSATTIQTPAREGYTFNGWSVSGTNITAQWTKNSTEDPSVVEVRDSENRPIGTYPVGTVLTIDPANEKDEPYTFTVGANNKTITVPTREGYTLNRWLPIGHTVTADWRKNPSQMTPVMRDDGKTVIGNFEVGVTLTINPNNGKDAYTVTVAPGLVIETPTKDGYNFVRWEREPVTTLTATWSETPVELGKVTGSEGRDIGSYPIGTVLTVDPDNGEGTYTVTVEKNTVIQRPTKNGYDFERWYATGNNIKAIWIKQATKVVEVRCDAGHAIGNFEVGVTLTFKPENGEPDFTRVVEEGLVIPHPVRPGYRFGEWKRDPLTTLTATWIPVSETAVYGANADVVIWNAVDALKNTSYASHTNGKGVSAQTGTDFVWTAAEDGKSIQLLAADGSNPNNGNEWENTGTLNSAPSLTFKVRVAVGGIYHLSFFSNSPDTSSDAFHVGVNGTYVYTTKDVISNGSDNYGSAAGERWFVCNLAKLNLNPGENTINIWARESGVLLRQFRLSRQNPIFVKKGWLEVPERVDGLISLTVDHAVEIPFGGSGSASVSATATNGKAVSYTVVSDHPEIATASVSGSSVSISAQSYGRAALTVTASADGCEDVIDVISVIVKDETSGTADAGAPVDLMMAPATATKDSITLVWDKPGGRAGNLEDYADVTGYNVYQGDRKIGDTGPKVTHFTAEGLNADTEYTFYVTAVRDGSEAKSVTITAKTRRDGGTIDVTKAPYNAKGDGTTKDTIAIQSAIDACPTDGTVLLPAGKTFLTGALDLKSNMTFQIDGTLQASPDVADYTAKPENYPAGHIITDPTNDDGLVLTRYEGWELYCYRSLLNVGHLNLMNRREVTCENVTISGSGVIKGDRSLSGSMRTYNQEYPAGSYTERRYPEYRSDGSNGRRQRGRLINIRQAKNVNLTGVTLRDGFCWNVHMVYCDTVTTHGVTWDMGGGDNLDGWDPDSTRNGMIFGCDLRTGDDCIAIKSGKNYDGTIVNMPTENIRIFDLEMGGGHGMAIGSEQSGGVENIYIRDLNVHDTSYGFELKANKVRGGYIKNVTLLDCTYNQFLAHSVTYNADGDPASDLPVFSDITIKNSVIANKSEKAIELIGFRDGERYAPLENVLFENVVVGLDVDGKNVDKYINIKDAKNIEFKNVTLTSGAPVRLQLSEVEGLTMTNDVPEFTKTIEAEAMNTAAESHDVYRAVYDKNASGQQVMSMAQNAGTAGDTLSAKYVGEAQDGANIIVTYYDETGATYTLSVNGVQVGEPWTSENTKAFTKKAVETDIKTGDVIALRVETTGKSKARVDMIKVGAAPSAENDSTIKFDGTAAPKEIELDAVTAINDLKARITPTFDGASQTYTFYQNEEDAKAEKNAISESESIYHGFCLVVTSQDETETSLYKFIVKPTEIDTVALITDNGTLDSDAYTTGTINGDNKAAATNYSIHRDSNTFYVKDATEGDYYQTVNTADVSAGKYTVTMWSRIYSARGVADVYLVPESGDPIKLGKADMRGNGPTNTTIAVVSDDGEPVSVPEGSYKLKFVCTASGESMFGKISLYPVGAYDGPAQQNEMFMMTRPELELDKLDDVEIMVEESTEITPEVTADRGARYQMEVTSGDEETVTAVLKDDTITLTGVQAGEATITVTLFSDDGEELAAQTFTVTVKDKEISEEDEELTDPVPEGAEKDSDENQIPEE